MFLLFFDSYLFLWHPVTSRWSCCHAVGALGAWFCIFYTIFYLTDTFSNVPYEAWGPEFTSDYKEKDRVFFVSNFFKFCGKLRGGTGVEGGQGSEGRQGG